MLLDRWAEGEKRKDYRAALICYAMTGTEPDEWFPWLAEELTPEETADLLKSALMGAARKAEERGA